MVGMAPWIAVVPLAFAVILLLVPKVSRSVRGVAALVGAAVTFAIAVWTWLAARGVSASFFTLSLTGEPASALVTADPVGLLLVSVFSFVWLLATLYSLGYITTNEHAAEYYGMLLLLEAAVLGFCLTDHLLVMFICWEVAAIATWRLVMFGRGDLEVRAAQQTLLLNFASAALMLTGLVWVAVELRTYSASGLSGGAPAPAALLLVLAGVLTKSASMPFYIWLPSAHSVAPSPMSALLSGTVAKLGLILYLRVFVLGGMVLPGWWSGLVAGIGIVSSLVAAGCALAENDIKRVLAFSTVSQLGYIFVAFALPAGAGVTAGLVYLVAHCLAKAGLFLVAGQVERTAGTRDLRQLSGIARQEPLAAAAAALMMLSIIGIPPLLGFFGKFYLIVAAARWSVLAAAGAVGVAVMTAAYLLRFYRCFVGDGAVAGASGRTGFAMAFSVAVLALATLLLGIVYPFVPFAGWLP